MNKMTGKKTLYKYENGFELKVVVIDCPKILKINFYQYNYRRNQWDFEYEERSEKDNDWGIEEYCLYYLGSLNYVPLEIYNSEVHRQRFNHPVAKV